MFNLFNSGGSTYSVLLERPNGFNKEVVIDDCFDENEAIERAEARYGLDAIRALWIGRN
tara:strand:+ start:1452 stop:1628 length:177 start_codon:yes stop_codon:yes gene_type:complete